MDRLAGDFVNIDDNLKFKATLRNHLIETRNWLKISLITYIYIFITSVYLLLIY